MSEATKLLTVETVYRDDDSAFDPYPAEMRLKDVRFSWQGVDYRRGVIRRGEPEELYSFSSVDSGDASVRFEIFGRADKDYESFEDGAAKIPPLHRFVFLLPKPPSDAQWWNADAWQDPELVEHEVLT